MSTISAGTTSTTTLIHSGDTTGSLVLKTNDTGSGGTTAVTIGTDQSFNFSATGQRITGDFSNATQVSRVIFQSSTGTFTDIGALAPSSSTQSSGWTAYLGNDPTNTSRTRMLTTSLDSRFEASITGTGTYLPMTFYTGGSERMRVDSSGNVGIGTSSPANKLDVLGIGRNYSSVTGTPAQSITENTGSGDAYVDLRSNSALKTRLYYDSANLLIGLTAVPAIPIVFKTTDTERMRIDSSGNLLVGNTGLSNSKFQLYQSSSGTYSQQIFAEYASGTGYFIEFLRRNSGTNNAVGAISASTTTTTYATSSDYRLKENIAPITGALTKISGLKPVTYKWKLDGSIGEGFIAHELAEIFPNAVVGEKDALDADGNPVYQGIDTSFLVATLTAALQELKALVDTQASTITQLQADVAALKGTS